MISLGLVFYVLDVQAVSDHYEEPVEQKQPQYEAVVEPDAIYEEPPQVHYKKLCKTQKIQSLTCERVFSDIVHIIIVEDLIKSLTNVRKCLSSDFISRIYQWISNIYVCLLLYMCLHIFIYNN